MGEPSEDTDIKTVPWHRIYYKDDGSGDAAAYGRLLADGDELVFSFIVDKDHRRKKIGTMLLREAIDFFDKTPKYKSMTYRVHKRNNPSISLVTKAGFSELNQKYLDKKIAESERVYVLHKQGYLDIGGKKVKVNKKSTIEAYNMPDTYDAEEYDIDEFGSDKYQKDSVWRPIPKEMPKTTEELMREIPKLMSLPIYGFKNPKYHCLAFTDHFRDMFLRYFREIR
jgi:GNAT superfamily N-acetyltransferase